MSKAQLFPELNRPQYPSSPEILISALAWSVVPRAAEFRDTGLMYHRERRGKRRGVSIDVTKPTGEALLAFYGELGVVGLPEEPIGLARIVAEAAANSYCGLRPPKGVGVTSTAVGLSGALLQDPVGGLGTQSPPNFAHLLNSMYALGGGEKGGAAESWFSAARNFSTRPPLRRLDSAFAATTLKKYLGSATWPPEVAEPVPNSTASCVPQWWTTDVLSQGRETPFWWFRTAWDRLCSPSWQEALPPRRWTGWAVCALRHALGFGFLWEANFYLQLARGVEDPATDIDSVVQAALVPPRPLVAVLQGSIAQKNVRPSMQQLLKRGLACRAALHQIGELVEGEPASLAQLIVLLRGAYQSSEDQDLRVAMSGGRLSAGSLKNLDETVRYSLLARGTEDTPDSLALLRVVSRNYTHVDPGAEWIVAMSAFTAESPTATIRLGDVMQSLEALGMRPRLDFLLRLLERGGLCASASDGDEGIEINLGFPGK